MLIAGANAENLPLAYYVAQADKGSPEHELKERCPLHIAATRARDSLTITSFGVPSEFLR